MPTRTARQFLRTWFADPVSVPVYVVISCFALLLALSVEPRSFGLTLFVVYAVLTGTALQVQRGVASGAR